MMTFLRNLFAPAPAAPAPLSATFGFDPEWTPEDAGAWLHFRHTPAGQKLGVMLANRVASRAVDATADRVHTVYACGVATGFRDAVATLDALLPSPGDEPAPFLSSFPAAGPTTGNQPEASPFDEGAAADLAHLAP